MTEDIKKTEQADQHGEEEKIENGFNQMETLYRSRCVQPPTAENVTVTEIDEED